jgi:hypothetical protein
MWHFPTDSLAADGVAVGAAIAMVLKRAPLKCVAGCANGGDAECRRPLYSTIASEQPKNHVQSTQISLLTIRRSQVTFGGSLSSRIRRYMRWQVRIVQNRQPYQKVDAAAAKEAAEKLYGSPLSERGSNDRLRALVHSLHGPRGLPIQFYEP